MCFKRSLICLSCVWLLHLVTCANGVALEDTQSDLDHISMVTSVTVACLSVLVLVFIVSLCGGCTPMEVGSDSHAATGSIKHGGNHGNYDSVATDANTGVLTAGTTLPNDPYQHQDNTLPYNLHPAGSTNAQGFAGYAPVQQPGGFAQGPQPTLPDYIQTRANPTSQQANLQNAHRPAYGSEPPPPAYEEATRATAPTQPAQPYGW